MRSFCPSCRTTIAWYDNLPVISWLILRGQCRSCHAPISPLYPAIELLTVIIMTLLVSTIIATYIPAYFIFFSALLVTIRSDVETLRISRFMSLYLIPLGWFFSYYALLPISITDSIAGTLLGYLFLFGIARIFHRLTGKHGIGQGDLELLAFVGAFTGVIGCWMTLLIGSVSGVIVGGMYMLLAKKQRATKIPFGLFLASAAIIYTLNQDIITRYLICQIEPDEIACFTDFD